MDVTVAIATFGGDEWIQMALRRAVPSVAALHVPFVQVHGATLHEARNDALALVETPYVVFLDADDELAPGYFDAMSAGTADVRAPAVRYISPTAISPPFVPKVPGHDHDCVGDCLLAGNWIVVGAVARTDLVRRVGGWQDWPIYEDFSVWQRCHLVGATFEQVPGAVYRAYVREGSRNRSHDQAFRTQIHRAIDASNREWFVGYVQGDCVGSPP
jgi:glycosyltransferase involved in cell wall biosynthesis